MRHRNIGRSLLQRIAIALGLLLSLAHSASAGLVTWEFAGDVTFVDDPKGQLSGGVVDGSEFTVSYTFDPATPDSSPVDSIFGIYNDLVTSFSGQFGSIPFSGIGTLDSVLTIRNHPVGFENDHYFLDVLSVALPTLSGSFDFFLRYVDGNGDTFTNDFLPVSPFDISLGFGTVSFDIDGDVSVGGHIRSITPEPTMLVLLATGVGVLLGRRSESS